MARARTHTLNERHLAILQWFDKHSVRPESPDGWCSERRVETSVRVNGERVAVGEAMHDLCTKLNERDDPFIITHPSGRHYRISDLGRRLARNCTTAKRMVENREVAIVVEKKTGKPPIIRMLDHVPVLPPDIDDEDELPPSDEAPQPEPEEDDETRTETVDLMPIDAADDPLSPQVEDDADLEPAIDDVNDDPPARRPAPKRNPAKAPPAKMTMPAIGKPVRAKK